MSLNLQTGAKVSKCPTISRTARPNARRSFWAQLVRHATARGAQTVRFCCAFEIYVQTIAFQQNTWALMSPGRTHDDRALAGNYRFT